MMNANRWVGGSRIPSDIPSGLMRTQIEEWHRRNAKVSLSRSTAGFRCEGVPDQTTQREDFSSTQYLLCEQQIASLEDEIARLCARRRQQARRDAPRGCRPSAEEDDDQVAARAWSPILARSSPSEDAIPAVDEVISDVEAMDVEESSFSSSSAASGEVTRPDASPDIGQDSRSNFDSPGPEIEDFEWLSTPEAPEVEDFEEGLLWIARS